MVVINFPISIICTQFFIATSSNELWYSCPTTLIEAKKFKLSLPHPSCGKFFTCSQGRMRERSCPVGLLFNSRQEVCDYPQNAKEDCEEKEALRSRLFEFTDQHEKSLLSETPKRQRNRRTFFMNNIYYDVETSSADSYVSEISSVSTEADSSSSWTFSSSSKRKRRHRKHRTTRRTTWNPDTTETITFTEFPNITTPMNTTTTTLTTILPNTTSTTPNSTTITIPDKTTTTSPDPTTTTSPNTSTSSTTTEITTTPKTPESLTNGTTPNNVNVKRTQFTHATIKYTKTDEAEPQADKESTYKGSALLSQESDDSDSVKVILLKNGCPGDPTVYATLPHPGDCAKFFYCWIGKKQVKQCPDGLLFNPRQHVCDWPKNVNCENKSPPQRRRRRPLLHLP